MEECDRQANLAGCTCSYTGCARKGKCCDCVAYHRDSGAIPGCFFPAEAEKSYDRSVAAFIKAYQD